MDVLLVDDVQFLQAKAKTEQEFFHTFNALHAGGAQLVLTSDRLPRDLDAMESRLRERFEAGLVCDIHAPDAATRLTILRKRVLQDELRDVAPEALAVIAGRVSDNVRALEGALVRVVAFGSLTGRAATAALADGGPRRPLSRERRPPPHADRARDPGAHRRRLRHLARVAGLAQPRRGVAWPRQVAMYLARELTSETLPAIGREFGGRSHTTVLHAHKRTVERMAGDATAFEAVRNLTQTLGTPA